MFYNTDMMTRKVRVETDTKAEAVAIRLKYGGTAVTGQWSDGGNPFFFWYSMPYFNEDIQADLVDLEVEFLPLTEGETPS